MLHPERMHSLGRRFYEQRVRRTQTIFFNDDFRNGMYEAWRSRCNLQHAACVGDKAAIQKEIVHRFNDLYDIGTSLHYRKSDIEGECELRTAGKAYQLENGTPVVNMEFIGVVLLSKIDHAAVVWKDGRIFGTSPILSAE